MTLRNFVAPAVLALSLAACGGGDKAEDAAADATAAPAEAEAKAETVVEKAVQAVKEAIKLDTSSPEAFKASLAAMKDSLSDVDKSKLTDALKSLGKQSVEEEGAGGLMGKIKDVADGKSLEDSLLDSMGDKLDGLTFEEILSLAG